MRYDWLSRARVWTPEGSQRTEGAGGGGECLCGNRNLMRCNRLWIIESNIFSHNNILTHTHTHTHTHRESECGITFHVLRAYFSLFMRSVASGQSCTATRSQLETEDLMLFLRSQFHHVNTATVSSGCFSVVGTVSVWKLQLISINKGSCDDTAPTKGLFSLLDRVPGDIPLKGKPIYQIEDCKTPTVYLSPRGSE